MMTSTAISLESMLNPLTASSSHSQQSTIHLPRDRSGEYVTHTRSTASDTEDTLEPDEAVHPRPAASNRIAQTTGPSKRRIAKACETCRLRRVKCSGDIPCKACRDAGTAGHCVVRVKARPNRPITARQSRRSSQSAQPHSDHPVLNSTQIHASPPIQSYLPHQFPPNLSPLLELSNASIMQDTRRDSTGTSPRYTPIRQIEIAVSQWCTAHDLSSSSVVFKDETRLSALHGSPLPAIPDIEAFEDELMRQLIITNDLEQASSIDRLQIVTLYNRYRIFPTALTADQKALVYASLCLAKHASMKSFVSTGTPATAPQTREDVTYFRMACECLAQWSFPSVHALWALVCLVPYSQGHGGLVENRELLRMMAWQVRELGLHRTDMGKLYLSGEMNLFPLFRYMDTFLAGLDDFHPFFTLAESDVDLSAFAQLLSPCQQTVSDHASRFHDDYNDPRIDVTSDEYVSLAESRWVPSLAQLQSGMTAGSKVKRSWSEIRYHCTLIPFGLRILLYFPRTDMDESRSSQAWIIVSHSTSQILYIHHELAHLGHLNPSWPQLRRFSICGQLLILCCVRHLYQPRQAVELFDKLFYLLVAHRTSWTSAGDLLAGFQRAAAVLGIGHSQPPPTFAHSIPVQTYSNNNELVNTQTDAFPFDPTLFFGLEMSDAWDLALNTAEEVLE